MLSTTRTDEWNKTLELKFDNLLTSSREENFANLRNLPTQMKDKKGLLDFETDRYLFNFGKRIILIFGPVIL